MDPQPCRAGHGHRLAGGLIGQRPGAATLAQDVVIRGQELRLVRVAVTLAVPVLIAEPVEITPPTKTGVLPVAPVRSTPAPWAG